MEELIFKLAEKLNVTTQYIMESLARQMFAEGIIGLIVVVFIIILNFFIFYMTFKYKEKIDKSYKLDFFPIFIIDIIFAFISFIIVLTDGVNSLLKIINPEDMALKTIFNLITGNSI